MVKVIHRPVPSVASRPTNHTHLMPPIYGIMGGVLRAAREKVGRTQEEVANAVSLTRTSLTNIEKGRQKLLLHTFAEIAAFLGRPASELLAEVEAKMAAERPSFSIPPNLSRKAHEQISGMLVGAREVNHHAKSSPQLHPRKGRGAAP